MTDGFDAVADDSLLAKVYFEASPEATTVLVKNSLFTLNSLKDYLSSKGSNCRSKETTSAELNDLYNKYISNQERQQTTQVYPQQLVDKSANTKGVENRTVTSLFPTQNYIHGISNYKNKEYITGLLKDIEIWDLIYTTLSNRAKNVLKAMGVTECGSLTELNLEELAKRKNVGKKTYSEIINAKIKLLNYRDSQSIEPTAQVVLIPPQSILNTQLSKLFQNINAFTKSTTIGDSIQMENDVWMQIEGMGIAFRDDPVEVWNEQSISSLAFRRYPISLLQVSSTAQYFHDLNKVPTMISDAPIIAVDRKILKRVTIPPLSRYHLHVLSITGYKSLPDINGISERTIIQVHGFCLLSFVLIGIFYIIAEMLIPQISDAQDYFAQDLTNCCEDLSSLINLIMKKCNIAERSANVFFLRHLHNNYRENTLEKIAKTYGLTRERIRQVEKKALAIYNMQSFPLFAACFLDSAENQITEVLVQHEKFFAETLCEKIGYKISDDHHGYAFIASRLEGVHFDTKLGYIYQEQYPCVRCEKLMHFIGSIFDNPETSMQINDVFEKVKAMCSYSSCTSVLSHGSIEYASIKLCNLEVTDGLIRRSSAYRSKKSILDNTIERICLEHETGIHFHDLAQILRRNYPKIEFTDDRMVHIWASKNRNLILWDRGTFVHRNFVRFNKTQMDDIYNWLKERLRRFGVQFISGAYRHFKKDLIVMGICHETALYMLLRSLKYNDLVFPKYPHIYLAQGYEGRLSSSAILEDYLEKCGGPTKLAEIRKYAVFNIGMKEFKMTQGLANSSNILRASSNEYVHFKYVFVQKETLSGLVDYTIQQAIKHGHIAIDSVFEEKKVTCKRLGISNSILLYSIIKSVEPESIVLSGYPTVTSSTKLQEYSKSIIERIVEYIKAKKAPCKVQEIEEHFCRRLGYKEQYIGLVQQNKNIFRYSASSIVHMDSIDGSTKINEVVNLAISKFDSISYWEGKWAKIEDLINIGLPSLPNKILWTNTLVSNILEKSFQVLIIGTSKKIYTIKDKFDIFRCNLGIAIQELLNEKYNGVANIFQIERELVTIGFIAHKLTNTMIDQCEEVVRKGEVVMISRIAKDAARY